MIGGIIEKVSAGPKALVCIPASLKVLQTQTISSAKPASHKHVLNNTSLRDKNVIRDGSFFPNTIQDSEKLTTNDNDSNSFLIENLSTSDLESALEEINSLISAKNVQFLRRPKEDHPIPVVTGSEKKNKSLLDVANVRYDLEGRRVILQSVASQYFVNAFESVGKFGGSNISCLSEMFGVQLAESDLFHIYNDCLHLTDNEPQNELFNHESSPESPGYTLNEVCELCRSDYPNQRAIGLRILAGVLQRRDLVVSLSSYHSSDLQGCGFGHSSVRIEFARYVKIFNSLVESCLSWGGFSDHRKVVCDILVDLMLRFCGSDSLPRSIPSLLSRSVQSSRATSPALRLATLHGVSAYLVSAVELAHSESLWCGLWGTYGVPPLLTPHAKRSDRVSYEQHLMNCREKAKKSSEAETNDENAISPPTQGDINDSFVLACRWSRVDTMVMESNVVKFLVETALDGLTFAIRCPNDVTNSAPFALGLTSVMTLCSVAVCAGSNLSLSALHDQLFVQRRNVLSSICDLSEAINRERGFLSNGGDYSAVLELLDGWLRLLTEMSRRCGMSSLCLFVQDRLLVCALIRGTVHRNILASIDGDVNHERLFSISVWTLRLWRVALVHGVGLDLLDEFLKPALSQNNVNLDLFMLKILGSASVCDFAVNDTALLVTELFWLFEQAVVTVAQIGTDLDEIKLDHCSVLLLQIASLVVISLSELLETALDNSATLARSSQLHFLSSAVGMKADLSAERSASNRSVSQLACAILSHTCVRGKGLVQQLRRRECSSALRIVCENLEEAVSRNSLEWSRAVLTTIRAAKSVSKTVDFHISSEVVLWRVNELVASLVRVFLMLCSVDAKQHEGVVQELVLLEHVVHKNTMSSGILSWQSSRLEQVFVLVRLQLLALVNDSILFTATMRSMQQFSDSLSGCAVFLFSRLLDETLVHSPESIVGNKSDSDLSEVHLKSVRKSLLSAVLGVEDVLPSDVGEVWSVAPFDTVFGRTITHQSETTNTAAADWVFDCFTGKLPLGGLWQYECLKHLRSVDLCVWLRALLNFEQDNSLLDGVFSTAECGSGDDDLSSSKIYHLLCLVTKSTFLEDGGGSAVDDVNLEMVNVYCRLLGRLVPCDSDHSQSFGDSLKSIAQKHHFSVSTSLPMRRRVSTSASPGGVPTSSSIGLLELCDELLESAFGCTVDSNVHAVTLRVLICPSVDWVVRERVWRRLGEVGLLHLLEGEGGHSWLVRETFHFGCEFYEASKQRVEFNVCLAILDGLNSLRGLDDRHWDIVGVGLFQIAKFIFNVTNEGSLVALPSMSEKLLVRVIDSGDRDAERSNDWLLISLFSIAAKFFFRSELSPLPFCTETESNIASLHVLIGTTNRQQWMSALGDVMIYSGGAKGVSIKDLVTKNRPQIVFN